MKTLSSRFVATRVLAGAAALFGACAPKPLPVVPASSAEAQLRVFVDPEATIEIVRDEKGREVVSAYHDALVAALTESGYRLVTAASEPHDLTLHLAIHQIGYTYRPWADHVVLQALPTSAANVPVAEVKRRSVNWVHEEGDTMPERLAHAARASVNALIRDPRLEGFAASRPAPIAAPAPALGPEATPPAPPAAPESSSTPHS